MPRRASALRHREEIQGLRQAIRDRHGCDSIHKASVPVNEAFEGQPGWEGMVEVFDLIGHPQAKRAYAWSHETDDGGTNYVAVLGVPPINSALDAVRANVIGHIEKQWGQ
jgi:hypothetical protein